MGIYNDPESFKHQRKCGINIKCNAEKVFKNAVFLRIL